MADSLFVFAWSVARGGYHWAVPAPGQPLPAERAGEERLRAAQAQRNEPVPVLTDGLPLETSGLDGKMYAPLTGETGLFRMFAEIRSESEDVLRFASQYGLLGVTRAVVEVPFAERPDLVTVGCGELLTAWQAEILAMREAATLWDLAEQKDETGLAAHIRWTDDAVFYVGEIGANVITSQPARFRLGDLIGPARHIVQRTVNERLEELVSPRLLFNPSSGKSALYFVPSNLLGAMWLQFARAIGEERKFRQCKYCRKWFEVSLEAARTSRFYCKPACRTKGYRQRKDDARRLHAEGVPLRKIALQLETSTEHLRVWLRGRGRARK